MEITGQTQAQIRWLLLRTGDALIPEEQLYRTALLDENQAIHEAQQLAADVGALMRAKDHPALATWFGRVEASVQPKIRSFATGLRRDQAAVEAAITSMWSNGQTEGQVHRLKALNRQMFRRAKLDLQRTRSLYAA